MAHSIPESITLKNGAQIPQSVFETIMKSLEKIRNDNLLAISELFEKCRDPRYVISRSNSWGNPAQLLQNYHLIGSDEIAPEMVRQIVLIGAEYEETHDERATFKIVAGKSVMIRLSDPRKPPLSSQTIGSL